MKNKQKKLISLDKIFKKLMKKMLKPLKTSNSKPKDQKMKMPSP